MTSSPLLAVSDIPQTQALETLAGAKRYNRWIFSTFQNALGPRVLEIGCGTGNFTRLLLEKAEHVTALDIHPDYIAQLQGTVQAPRGKTLEARCQNVMRDTSGLGQYDTVVMLNVLEHLPDAPATLKTLHGLLTPGGRIVILVPALQALYSPFDQAIGHYLRYNKSQLQAVLDQAGFSMNQLQYFNLLGIAGWWWNFCRNRRLEMGTGSLALFESLVPLLRLAETLCPPPVGLSLIAIAHKP